MSQRIDIDEIMAKTWLTVTLLQQECHSNDTEPLYDYCCRQIDTVKAALAQTRLNAEDIDHITYAQCALLDDTAMALLAGDEIEHEELYAWKVAPLQARYFSSLDAGEALWTRIQTVLAQVAPENAVLVCFHRVLMLGFRPGESATPAFKVQRESLIEKLSARIPPTQQSAQLVIQKTAGNRTKLIRSVWFWIFLLVIVLAVVSWGGNVWLSTLLSVPLPVTPQ